MNSDVAGPRSDAIGQCGNDQMSRPMEDNPCDYARLASAFGERLGASTRLVSNRGRHSVKMALFEWFAATLMNTLSPKSPALIRRAGRCWDIIFCQLAWQTDGCDAGDKGAGVSYEFESRAE